MSRLAHAPHKPEELRGRQDNELLCDWDMLREKKMQEQKSTHAWPCPCSEKIQAPEKSRQTLTNLAYVASFSQDTRELGAENLLEGVPQNLAVLLLSEITQDAFDEILQPEQGLGLSSQTREQAVLG